MVTRVPTIGRKLSRAEKEKVINQYLGNKFSLKGDHLAVLSSVIDYISNGDSALGITETGVEALSIWLPRVGTVLESSAFVFVSESFALGSIILFPVGGIITVINAHETVNQAYGMRAVAYTTTAWAFDDPIPLSSPTKELYVRQNLGEGKAATNTLTAMRKVWVDAKNATLLKLKSGSGKEKKAAKLLYRAIGDGDRQKLMLSILKGFATKMSYQEKIWFEADYSIRYPN
jgi:hypothetical protein